MAPRKPMRPPGARSLTLEYAKKQASRLAEYLGVKHRLNLKHASALEAIAAVHGARNWQTLAARAADGASPSSAIPDTPAEALAVSWQEDGRPHITLARQSWLRHAVAFGNTQSDWLHANLGAAAEAGLAALMFTHGDVAAPVDSTGSTPSVAAAAELTPSALFELLGKPGFVLVAVNKGEDWTGLLREALLLRKGWPHQHPFVVALPELSELGEAEQACVLALAREVRAFGGTLRCAASAPDFVAKESFAKGLFANMTHRVFLPSARQAAREELLMRFEAAPAVCLSADGCRL